MMKEERSPEEILELHELRRADPQRFLEVIDEWLQENPNNFRPYVSRLLWWSALGRPRRAFADLDKVIEFAQTKGVFFCRGRFYREQNAACLGASSMTLSISASARFG